MSAQAIGRTVEWSPRPPVAPVTLTGRYVRLEPLTDDHVPALFAATCRPDDDPTWTYLPDHRPTSLAELAAVVQRLHAVGVTFAISAMDGPVVGMASLIRTDAGNGSTEVGFIVYGAALRRTRAATETQYLLARHVFEDLGYRRYEWKCDDLNEPSRAAAVRLGFQFEGVFRQALVYKGRNRDTAWYAAIDDEWPAIKRGYETWLDPTNFDESGHQLRPLRAAGRAPARPSGG